MLAVFLCGCRSDADSDGFSAFKVRGKSYTGRPARIELRDGRVVLEVGASDVRLAAQSAETFGSLQDAVGKTLNADSVGTVSLPAGDYPLLRIQGGSLTLQSVSGGRAQGNYNLKVVGQTSDGAEGAALEVIGSFDALID